MTFAPAITHVLKNEAPKHDAPSVMTIVLPFYPGKIESAWVNWDFTPALIELLACIAVLTYHQKDYYKMNTTKNASIIDPIIRYDVEPNVIEMETMFAWIGEHDVPAGYKGTNRVAMSIETTKEMDEMLNERATNEEVIARYRKYFAVKDQAFYDWVRSMGRYRNNH
ncbi:hypothetical protein V1522DRAFT_418589 [Lipomyces starkeyi]